MKRSFLATCALMGASAFFLTSATSCDLDGNDLGKYIGPDTIGGIVNGMAGCPNLEAQYQEALNSEGELISIDQLKQGMADGTVGFSMAMLLNKSGVNKLFAAATDFKYEIDVSVAKVILKLPTIQLDGCPKDQLIKLLEDVQKDSAFYNSYYADQIRQNNEISCITMDLPVQVKSLISDTTYGVKVALPIYGKIKGDNPSNAEDYAKGLRTSIFADLKHAQLIDFAGIPQAAIDIINLAWQQFVSNQFRNVSLFDIGAWNVGNGDIKLIAGAPIVKSDSKAIQLGVYSNVVYARNSTTAIDYAFPDNADVGLNIHPDLIRGLLARMMKEGHITSDAKLENNDFKVTMTNIAKEYPENILLTYDWYNQNPQNWGKYFSLAFRLWSNSSICGYVDLIAGLNAEITEKKFSIGVGNVHAGKSDGTMSLFAAGINAITDSAFFHGILDYTTVSFNFNEIGVSTKKEDESGESLKNAEMGALKFTIDGNGISLFLNFVDL